MKKELFQRFIAMLEKSRLRYALLGNTDFYPETIGSDVDVMLHPEDIRRFHQLIWNIEDANTRVVQMLQHETVAFYYVVAQFGQDSVSLLQPDVCTDYYRNGVKLLSAEELLRDTVYATDEAGQSKGFRVLAQEKAFIYYLLKKIDKGALDEIQFAHLRALFFKNPTGALAQCYSFWSNELLLTIQKTFESNDLCLLQRQIPLLRHELHGSLLFSPKDALKRFLLRVSRCLRPTGFVIQIEPGDASADDLAKELFELLGGAFRRWQIIDLSTTPRLARLFLPTRVLKARVCSTLVILLGERKLWLAHVDARITTQAGKVHASLAGWLANVLDEIDSSQTPHQPAQTLLDVLSKRTRSRCWRLCRQDRDSDRGLDL